MAKILIVEDNVDLAETYRDFLEFAGHVVTLVHNGTEAIEYLIRRRLVPDVIILDMQLPGDSGVVVLGLIRGMPRLVRAKVIIASGHADISQWAIKQWGADLFLQKPISLEVLKRTIDDFSISSASPSATSGLFSGLPTA
ncbi:MAG TPA: response regulator [Anaerolineales bacterium]|nr:response regulator [Anaerolineales bacterium]HEX3051346.1 response regulator [Aggregatilineaceae bacterium]